MLEHIVAWLRAGIPPGDEQLGDARKKSAEPPSEPPSAVTAAGFATRGAFAAAVLHTARAACAGVLRASSAKALAAAGQTRAGARSDGPGAAFSARGPSGTPRGASPSFPRGVEGSSPGGGDVADIADESQFPSLGGARRRLDDATGANGYGGEPRLNANARAEEDSRFPRTGIQSRPLPAFPALPSRPSVRPPRTKAPKRIQPTSTFASLAPGAREGPGGGLAEEDSERGLGAAEVETATTSTAYEQIGTPRRAAAAARGEGENPVTPGSAVAAPPLRRVDFSASPGAEKNGSTGVFFGAGAGALVGSSLFPASSADAEAEAAAEADVATRLREATKSDGRAETRRSSFASFELSPPLVALATFHAAVIRHGIVPDLAPEVAFLCDALAAPIDVVADEFGDEFGDTLRSSSETYSVVVASGAAARRYAALALSRSGRAPHAAGERALGALCASAALRRHAPALHASLARELGEARRRELLSSAADPTSDPRGADGRGAGETFGVRGSPGSSLFGGLLAGSISVSDRLGDAAFAGARSMDAIDAAGPAPPRGGGGVAGAGGFGGAANTEKAYRNREKSRDALYARLRALAADGGGAGSMPRDHLAADRPHRHAAAAAGGARGGRGARGGGPHDGAARGFGVREKAYDLLDGVLPENTRWFAELFVSRLARAAAAGEADEELGAAVAPARLSKLHDRLTGSQSRESIRTHRETHRESVSASPRPGGAAEAHPSSKKHLASYGYPVSSSFACLFPNAQRPFVRLIESLDSHRLAQALQRALVAALHALDPDAARVGASDESADDDSGDDSGDGSDSEGETRGSCSATESSRLEHREDRDESGGDSASFAPLTLSPGGVVPSPPERRRRGKGRGKRTRLDTRTKTSAAFTSGGGGVTERALAARAVAGVLGVLHFGSGAAGAGATSAAALAPPPGIDPATALAKSAARGGLPLTAPWVLAFYRFLPWDAEAATAPCHLRALSVLRALRLSPELAPTHATFGAPQMALRAVLADGLAVAAPTTPAARAVFVGTCFSSDFRNERASAAANASLRSGLALPPLAALPGLPPTRRDPRRYTYRGSPRENRSPDETPAFAAESSGAFVPVDRRYLEWACPGVDAAAARLARAAAAERAAVSAQKDGGALGHRAAAEPAATLFPTELSPGRASSGAEPGASRERRETPVVLKSEPPAVSAPSTPGAGSMGSMGSMGSTPPATPNAGSAAAPRRVVASRVDAAEVMTDSRTARARPDAPAAPRARESGIPSETRVGETRASIGSKEKKQKSAFSAEKTERALQRAFLARYPTARRVVEFVADAAALAAADAVSAVAADEAATGFDAAVAAAAASAASAAPPGCAPDDAWSPALEDAVERAAIAAARDALAPASRRAAEDAARRAAAATEALLVPGRTRKMRDAPAADAGPPAGRPAGPASGLASARVPSAAAAAAADAARLAAADRVRRTLPFEIHARVQSAARAKLRAALAEARAAKKKLGDVSTAAASATSRSSRVSAATAALVAAANANAAANAKAANAARGGDADDETRVRVSSLSFSARRAASALRVALAATTGSVAEDRNDSTERKLDGTTRVSDDDDDDVAAVTGLADALVASLFHAPPRRADPLRARNESPEKTCRLSAREWDDAADAAAAFARLVASQTDATAAWDAFASAFFDPAKHWAPRMAAFPESPHTQRAAEDAAPSFFRRLLDARGAKADGKLGELGSFAIGADAPTLERSRIATNHDATIDREKKEDFDAMGVAVARSTRDMLLTVTSEESVGCVGAAAALRAGAALADVLGSTLADSRASDARRTETERLFKCLLRLCLNAGERRTARRVENSARRCGFSVSVT